MNKTFFFISAGLVFAAYIAGRYSAPEKIKTEREYIEREAKKLDLSKDLDLTVTSFQIERPDGTKVTKTRSHTTKRAVKNIYTQSESNTRVQTIIENRRGVTISALVGLPLSDLSKGLTYGAAFTKQFIGPLSLGAWAFTDLRVGLSIGVEL